MKNQVKINGILSASAGVLLISSVATGAPVSRIAERGANHEVVELVELTLDADGSLVTKTNSYTRVEDGLNYLSEQNSWDSADPRFELVPGAALAWKGQQKISISGNPNGIGAVQIRLPDGRLLSSHVWGLAYRDLETGKSVLIAEIQDSAGVLVNESTLLFPRAFGSMADLRYSVTKQGLEQDIVVRERLPPPESFQLGPKCRLEVWTEFTGSPEPQSSRRGDLRGVGTPGVEPQADDDDEILDFGSARIGDGRSFRLGAETETVANVVKNWVTTEDGRKFLVEGVPLASVASEIELLPSPDPKGGADVRRRPVERLQAFRALPPKSRRFDQANATIRRLQATEDQKLVAQLSRPGLVLDYVIVSTTQSTYTFASDETYFISGPVTITSSCVMEGGTVLKLDTGSTAKVELTGSATLTWGGDIGRPVIFSSKNDNSVGETISGSTGDPSTSYVGYAALVFSGSAIADIKYASFRHQQRGVQLSSGTGHIIKHSQWVHCNDGIIPNGTVGVRNGLFNNVTTVFSGGSGTLTGQHITINQAGTMSGGPSTAVYLANSLLVQITTLGTYTSSGSVYTLSSSSGVFESVTGGNHYLAPGSSYRNLGLATIDTTLATELKTLTTSAPRLLTGPITVATTLVPQAPRDYDTPDVGYHYVPVDFVVSNVVATAALTLGKGVSVAVAGSYGVDLQAGGQFISEGWAEKMNRLTRWQCVQEQSVAAGNGGPLTMTSGTFSPRPVFVARFTDVSAPAKSGNVLFEALSGRPFQTLQVEFCQLRNVGLSYLSPNDTAAVTITLRNNLFERGQSFLRKNYLGQNTPITATARNNLFWRGALELWYDSGTSNPGWTLRDNLFDVSVNTLTGTGTANITMSNDGFTTGTTAVFTGVNDKTGLSTDYQVKSGWGRWYYPASGSSPSLATLIDAGQQSRENAGLYHFTVKVANATKEGADASSSVDIGFHYLGLNSGGLPNDYDGDGLPDYLEDRNGNSTADSGEQPWQSSFNGTTGIPGLQLFNLLE